MLVSAGGDKWPTYALLDTGANASAIQDDLCLKINAPLTTLNINLGTFDQNSSAQREVASFTVSNLTETFSVDVQNALVGKFLSTENEKPPKSADFVQYDHLKDLVFNELDDTSVGLLLDAKYAESFMAGRVYVGKSGEPIGVETNFGNTIMGPKPESFDVNVVNNDISAMDIEPDVFTEEIRRIFRHDFISRESERFPSEMVHPSADDEWSLQQMKDTLTFNGETGHYSVGLPWRLGRGETAEVFKNVDFYSAALSRHEKLKKKLERDAVLKQGTFAQMQEKLDKKFVRQIESLEHAEDSPLCYLPVHVALHPEKPLKFRICMDGASKVGPHSLNKYLLSGPDFFNRLVSVLLRFRQKKYTLTADIRDFFYQVECAPPDRTALRCLWWEDITMKKTIVLEALVHIFGAASSPAVANFVLRTHAEAIKDLFAPAVYEALLKAFYVDDLLTSVDSEEEVEKLKEDLTAALAMGGFTITKWKSNVPGFSDASESISSPPSSQVALVTYAETVEEFENNGDSADVGRSQETEAWRAPLEGPTENDDDEDENLDPNDLVRALSNKEWEGTQVKELTTDSPDKILGVGYDYLTDNLTVRVKEKHFRDVVTKRQVLSFISSVYDPLGLVSPYILHGRQFFQLINESGISWNDPVPTAILDPFLKWKAKIIHLTNLKVPRWTNPLGLGDSINDLVIFCDSSAVGYGFACYVRRSLQGGGGQISVSILLSKSHVVPVSMNKNPTENAIPHGDSIPRLELNAARGAAEWRDTIIRESGETYHNVYMFSDSLTVLGWLNNFEKRFKTFENFRIKAIRALSKLLEWRHCPTLQNPADLCSKGIEANDFKKWEFLHNGPSFLLSPLSEWPPIRPETTSPETSADINVMAARMGRDEIVDFSPIELLAIGATTAEIDVEVEHKEGHPWPLLVSDHVSIWSKKVRLIAMVRRVILTLKERVDNRRNNLTNTRLRSRETRQKTKLIVVFSDEEKNKAEDLLISAIQSIHFEKEILALLKNGVFQPNAIKELNVKGSSLTHLSPFIDERNVMRVGGRCRKAESIPYDTRFPKIMPNHRDERTQSLIRHYHVRNMHTTKLQTYYLIRHKFFVLGGKTSVSLVINRCLSCQRNFKAPTAQREGDLPSERLEFAVPFENSGADVFGPFHLRHSGRGTIKRFVLMVTCLGVRAVALFPLKNMSTSSVVNALVRMNAQYPGLKKVFSDQGSNFKGADREIREAVAQWNKDLLNSELEKVGVTWHFGPAACGSAGGAWERLIGLTKNLLKSVLEGKTVDSDDFDTMLAGAAAIMNRRPLMQASADPSDPLVLSPAHFLHPYVFANSATNILPPNSGDPERLRAGWRATQSLLDEFFREFKSAYLTTLAKRRVTSSTPAVKPGTIVILVEKELPREEWRLCVVQSIESSDANHPRKFVLKDKNGHLFTRANNGFVTLEL